MRVGGEAIHVKGTGIENKTGNGTGIENVILIVKDLEIGTVEVVGMEEEGGTGTPGMEEMEAGIGTATGAGHALLLGMVTGGHLEVQFAHISEICR